MKLNETLQCDEPALPLIDVPGVFFYKDNDHFKTGHASIIDPERLKLRNDLIKPLNDFLIKVESFIEQKSLAPEGLKKCTENWLYSWASKGALEGKATTQGIFERTWFLAGISLAYLKAKPRITWHTDKQKTIEQWLNRLALLVQKKYDNAETSDSIGDKNNHLYWAGLSVATVGIISNDRELFSWGISKNIFGINQITQDGFLPFEAMRGRRALVYHSFALQALMMTALIAKANNMDLINENNKALYRLATTTLASYKDPSKITKLVGIQQEIPEKRLQSWIEIFNYLLPGAVDYKDLKNIRPANEKWLGGNLTNILTNE